MSDYIAEAKVLVLPDVSKFNSRLKTDLNTKINEFNKNTSAKLKPVQIPVTSRNITKGALNTTRVAAQKTANTLKPVQLKTTLAGVTGTGAANRALSQTGASTTALNQNLKQLNTNAGKSRAALLGLGSASGRLDAALLGLRTAVGSTAVIGLGAAALAAIALGKAIRSTFAITVAFERELNVFQATTGASASEMERVAAAAKQLGADVTLPAVSAADAAVAMSELAKAGLSVQDAIDGARGVLQLATAANIGFADAVELSAAVLNAFQLSGKDAIDVADTLANAANAAQGSITDIGLSLSQSSAVAEQAGISYRDTTLFLTLLARAGLKGSDAGTSLRTAIIRLIKPSQAAQKALDDLGIVLRDQQGNIRPDVFLQISNAMRGMSPAARDATLALIGGQDALRALAILGRVSVSDFIALRRELRQQGTAADLAAARTKGLGGAMQALQSTLETVAISIGQKVSPGFTDFVNGVTASISALSESEGLASAFAGAMTGIGTALNAVGQVASTVGPILLGVTNILGQATFGFGSSFVTAILAAVVALKAFSVAASATAGIRTTAAVAIGFATAVRETEIALGTATVALTGFQRAAIGTRAVLAGLVSSINFWLVAITAVGAGLVYLVTRESELERATKNLKTATDELVAALEAQDAAQKALSGAKLGRNAAKLALLDAEDRAAAARAALEASAAPLGSRERTRLEIELAVAIDDVTAARQRQREAEKQFDEAQRAKRVRDKQASDARKTEKQEILDIASALQRRADIDKRLPAPGTSGGLESASDKAARALRIEKQLTEDLTRAILDRALEQEKEGEAFNLDVRDRLKLIAALRTSTKIPIKQLLQIVLSTPNFRDVLSKLSQVSPEFERALSSLPKDVQNIIRNAMESALPTAIEGGGKLGGAAGNAFTLSFDEALAAATARGVSDSALLALARAEQAKATAAFNKIDAATQRGTKFKSQAQEDAFNAAVARKNAADAEVNRILGDIESAGAEQESKIKDAQDKRDQRAQNLFDLLTGSGKATSIQNKITRAALTPSLSDDIKFTKALVTYFQGVKKTLLDRLKEIGASTKVIKQISAAIDKLIFDTTTDLKSLQQQQNEAIQDALMTKIDAQIRFFEIKGNVAGQIKAHRAKLAAITRELVRLKNQGKKNTAAWWDLKAQQAEEQAAIKELNKQTKEKNNAAASLMFTFLQAQQGFAANLLGNLIGGGLTGGLVGNVSPTGAATGGGATPFLKASPGRALNPEADLVAQGQISAGAKLGVSRGQGTTQVELLRSILQALNDIKRGAGFPGAQYQRRRQSAAMDTGGGGGVVAQ